MHNTLPILTALVQTFILMETPTTTDGSVQTLETNKGGKRIGAGRKKSADPVRTASIALRAMHWNAVDEMRGEVSRSAWMRSIIEGMIDGRSTDTNK